MERVRPLSISRLPISFGTLTLGTAGSATGLETFANTTEAGTFTIGSSPSTTSNTMLGPTAAITNGHLIYCATSGTTYTMIDSGVPFAGITARLSALTNAGGSNTLASANNGNQFWGWTQTTNNQTAFKIYDTAAATGTGDLLMAVATAAGSTEVPLTITNSLTGSQTLPALSVAPTWNTTGVVDAGIFENVTNGQRYWF